MAVEASRRRVRPGSWNLVAAVLLVHVSSPRRPAGKWPCWRCKGHEVDFHFTSSATPTTTHTFIERIRKHERQNSSGARLLPRNVVDIHLTWPHASLRPNRGLSKHTLCHQPCHTLFPPYGYGLLKRQAMILTNASGTIEDCSVELAQRHTLCSPVGMLEETSKAWFSSAPTT